MPPALFLGDHLAILLTVEWVSGNGGANMKLIVLLAVSQCFGLPALCQSPATLGTTSHPGENQPPTAQGLFELQPGVFSWNTSVKSPSCNTPETAALPAAPGDRQVLKGPCLDPQILAMSAQNNMQAPPLPGGKWPRAKSIPIPTQWPNAKFERIPTEWPNLKLMPIAGQSGSPKPAK